MSRDMLLCDPLLRGKSWLGRVIPGRLEKTVYKLTLSSKPELPAGITVVPHAEIARECMIARRQNFSSQKG